MNVYVWVRVFVYVPECMCVCFLFFLYFVTILWIQILFFQICTKMFLVTNLMNYRCEFHLFSAFYQISVKYIDIVTEY